MRNGLFDEIEFDGATFERDLNVNFGIYSGKLHKVCYELKFSPKHYSRYFTNLCCSSIYIFLEIDSTIIQSSSPQYPKKRFYRTSLSNFPPFFLFLRGNKPGLIISPISFFLASHTIFVLGLHWVAWVLYVCHQFKWRSIEVLTISNVQIDTIDITPDFGHGTLLGKSSLFVPDMTRLAPAPPSPIPNTKYVYHQFKWRSIEGLTIRH